MPQHAEAGPDHVHVHLGRRRDLPHVHAPVDVGDDPVDGEVPVVRLELPLGSEQDGHGVVGDG